MTLLEWMDAYAVTFSQSLEMVDSVIPEVTLTRIPFSM
jgi:hypothetical protein